MLEIIILCTLYGASVPKVKKKNRSKWLPLAAPALWIIGKYVCVFISGLIFYLKGMSAEDIEFYIQGAAWCGGLSGAGIAFLIIHILPVRALECPRCNHSFKIASDFGVTCKNCNTRLKVSFNKVTELKTA